MQKHFPVLSTRGQENTHSFNQAEAATGRLSSLNPNLQNIPIRTEEGRKIRKAFVTGNDDYLFFSADYSQVELRLMAHLSQDKELIHAFNHGIDVHTATASKIYHVTLEEVTPEMRRRLKQLISVSYTVYLPGAWPKDSTSAAKKAKN